METTSAYLDLEKLRRSKAPRQFAKFSEQRSETERKRRGGKRKTVGICKDVMKVLSVCCGQGSGAVVVHDEC